MRHVGVLMGIAEDDAETKARLAKFRQELERLGWSEGRNVRIDIRFAPGGAQAQALAKELVALRPDVILAHSAQIAAALQRETRAIPIVFVNVNDPIGAGFVASVARPGGNLTGLLHYEEGISGKWLGLLKEIAPRLARAALVANPKNPVYDYFVRSANAAAASLAIELVRSPVENAADIERQLDSLRARAGQWAIPAAGYHDHYPPRSHRRTRGSPPPAGGVLVPSLCRGRGSHVLRHRPDQHVRQTASYVDRILHGAKPADLPVQAPTRYETVLNLKTAKALGLTVPPGLLVAADEVIE